MGRGWYSRHVLAYLERCRSTLYAGAGGSDVTYSLRRWSFTLNCRPNLMSEMSTDPSSNNSRTTLTKRDHEVVENTWSRVKIESKLTNFMKLIQIQGYNGKYESNPQGIRKILNNLFKFDQIRQWIGDRNWGKWYFMKEDLKKNPQNQKSMNLTLISQRNCRLKGDKIIENHKNEITKIKAEIKLINDSKIKLNAKRR